jgi:RNA-directed DNA polymerase
MGREFHVRFREGLGVQFPRATRLVMGFTDESDARRVMEVLPKRLGKYGLAIHPDKTRRMPFVRSQERKGREEPQGGNQLRTFDFLGFTHYWGKSRRNSAIVKKRTAASRIRRFAKAIGEWCRRNRHRPIQEQHETLSQKLRGHDAYYGVTGNCASLNRMRAIVARIWRKWLSRRSWKGCFGWASLWGLLERMPLPAARVVHSVYRRV